MGFKIENGVLIYYIEEKGVTEVVIPETVTSIGFEAFYRCGSLTSVIIPETVTSIGDFAFAECGKLKNISIPKTVTNIGGNAFSYTPWIKKKSRLAYGW